jgi:methionine-rich copper-binding protein CopC
MDGAAQQDLGPLPTTASEHFSVAAPVLAKGHYWVSWRALSADSHVVSGEFMFVIGAAGDSATAGGNHDSHSAAH